MSTPNLPHTENLTPLFELVLQLHQLLQQKSQLQSSILESIDILSIKSEEEPNQEYKKNQIKQLREKNVNLLEKLKYTSNYLDAIVGLINNYEISIQTVLEKIRVDVIDYNLQLLQRHREYYNRLIEKNKDEYDEYSKLIDKKTRLFKISECLRKVGGGIDEASFPGIEDVFELQTMKYIMKDLIKKRLAYQVKYLNLLTEQEKKSVSKIPPDDDSLSDNEEIKLEMSPNPSASFISNIKSKVVSNPQNLKKKLEESTRIKAPEIL